MNNSNADWQRREGFEKWYRDTQQLPFVEGHWNRVLERTGEYLIQSVQWKWEVWQAALDHNDVPTVLQTIIDYPIADPKNMDAANMKLIAINAMVQPTAQPAPMPVALQHMAVAENGILHWMSGRKIDNCELYAMPDFGRAPFLYTSPQPPAVQPASEWNDAIEAAALRIENGSFLHDQAPTALFAKEAAKAIRALKRQPSEVNLLPQAPLDPIYQSKE